MAGDKSVQQYGNKTWWVYRSTLSPPGIVSYFGVEARVFDRISKLEVPRSVAARALCG